MSSALQQAQQHLFAETLKGDGERDDALIQRLKANIPSLHDIAGEAVLLPRIDATNFLSLQPMLHSSIVRSNSNCRQKNQQPQDEKLLTLSALRCPDFELSRISYGCMVRDDPKQLVPET